MTKRKKSMFMLKFDVENNAFNRMSDSEILDYLYFEYKKTEREEK